MATSRRKSKKTKIFVILILAAIAIGSAGFLSHQLFFKSLSPQEKAKIDDEIDRITQGILEEIENDSALCQEEAGAGEPFDGEKSEIDELPKDKVCEIMASYQNGFARLQDEGNAIVDRLILGIKADYRDLKAENAGKLELAKLASSYMNRAKALESGMDSSISVLSLKMNEDLVAAGMEEKDVKDYIDKIKDEYKKQKEERRKLLLSKAKEYL